MTWFRVGGAGIPATLKNAMNAVFNKKFGTSGQDYPPKQWPDDVNLLGPLPEKTVAGAIAHTDDAADKVPVKSMICSIVPKQAGSGTPSPSNVRALSGYTGISVSQRGKNLLNWSDFSDYSKWKTDISSNQSFPTNASYRGLLINLPIGTYTISFGINSSSFPDYLYLCSDDGSTSVRLINFAQGQTYYTNTGTFTVESGKIYFFRMGNMVAESNFNALIEKISWAQIEVGSSATSFEAYNAAADISDSWSSIGAILGGERNLSDGTMSSYGYLYDLGSNNWISDPNRPGVFYSNTSASGRVAGSNVLGCDCFETRNITVSTSYDNYISGAPSYGGMYIFIRCTDFANMTVAEVKTALTGKYVCLKSSNATSYSGLSTYDFETLYAVNNFFSDIVGGQTQLTYRQDIALALQAVSSSRGLMMASRPATQLVGEESDPDQVNELVENDEIEQEGEDNAR